MTPPIVVGIDPLRHDPGAAVLAAWLARATGAPVVAVAACVHDVAVRWEGARAYEQQVRGMARERLSAIEPAFHGVEFETTATSGGSVARVLHDCAEERGAGLLVAGASHHGLLGRIPLGSTADRLLHGAPCPVAVAPAGFGDRVRGIDRIGAAFIDSEEGYEALRGAAALAAACGAELYAVTAVEPVAWSATSLVQPYDVGAHLAQTRERAALRLRGALEGIAPEVSARSEVLVNSTVTALEQLSNDVDLLVCGSRGHGPLGSVLLGSVSRRLIYRAACPVVIVPRGTPRGLEALTGAGNRIGTGHVS